MKPSPHQISTGHHVGICFLLTCLLTGCAVVGPTAVRTGRLAYNEAIIETDKQQILLLVVRNRYEERSNLLALASVTANISVVGRIGTELGFGEEDSFAGNLVPFGAGLIYEENPTISYVPVGGERYARELMSPVPVAALAQLTGTMVNPNLIYEALVSNVNGISNPDFVSTRSEPDPRFARVVSIMTDLTRAHRLHWAQDAQADQFSIVIDHYSPAFTAEVSELLRLLGLSPPESRSARIVLPVSLALDGPDTGGIAVITRSVFNLVEILSGAVEIPEQDRADGVAVSYPTPGLVGKALRVHRAEAEPERASVAVKYRDGWFYVDERDRATKQFFRLLSTLLSIAIEESTAADSATPVLTVPVSR